jgi:hypothetical protein
MKRFLEIAAKVLIALAIAGGVISLAVGAYVVWFMLTISHHG